MSLRAHAGVEKSVGVSPSATVSQSGFRGTGYFRLPYHLVEPVVIVGDVLIILAACLITGFGYNWLAGGYVWLAGGYVPAIEQYAAIGVLASINVSAVLAARGDYRVINLLNFYRQVREVIIMWSGVLLVLIGVAFALKIGDQFSRGATFTFSVVGVSALLAWRRFVAQFLAHALSTGAFAPRNVILIGEQNRLTASRTIFEMRRCGYNPIRTFEIGQEEFIAGRVSRSLRALIDGAIEAARSESVAEILLLIGWEHRRTIESISKLLNVIPTPVYLLPDDNVARFLGNRAINVGTTWAAEIQRAPLTRIEQITKRCVDIMGATAILSCFRP